MISQICALNKTIAPKYMQMMQKIYKVINLMPDQSDLWIQQRTGQTNEYYD